MLYGPIIGFHGLMYSLCRTFSKLTIVHYVDPSYSGYLSVYGAICRPPTGFYDGLTGVNKRVNRVDNSLMRPPLTVGIYAFRSYILVYMRVSRPGYTPCSE